MDPEPSGALAGGAEEDDEEEEAASEEATADMAAGAMQDPLTYMSNGRWVEANLGFFPDSFCRGREAWAVARDLEGAAHRDGGSLLGGTCRVLWEHATDSNARY